MTDKPKPRRRTPLLAYALAHGLVKKPAPKPAPKYLGVRLPRGARVLQLDFGDSWLAGARDDE